MPSSLVVNASLRKLFFRPRPFLDAARRDWQFDAFAWLLARTGGFPKFMETTLVLPGDEHFPDRGLSGHAAAAALFRRVRDHAGMADWPCVVEPGPATADAVSPSIPVIRYDPDMAEPMSLVATFANEFAHYLTSTFDDPPPGGEAMRGPATDLAAVFMGFGIFMANSAFQFARYEDGAWQGWRTRTQGFLNEGELVHALALFCLLRNIQPEDVEEPLNPHLRKYLRLAARDLAQYGDRFQRLRASVPALTRDPASETLPSAG